MASNSAQKQLSAPSARNPYTLSVSFYENSTSIETNTSNITVSGSFASTGASWSSGSQSTLGIYWYDDFENTGGRYLGQIDFSSIKNSETKSVSQVFDVKHKDDGTLNGYAYITFTKGGTSSYTPASTDLSTSSTPLNYIARKTACPSLSGLIGSNYAIWLNPASVNFRHTVRYNFGALSGVIATDVYNSCNFTIPFEFYSQIPYSKNGTGTLTVDTYNNGVLIGSVSANLYVQSNDSDCIPIIDFSVKDIRPETLALTNDENTIILNQSNAQLTISHTAKYYSTLTAVYVNGINIGLDLLNYIINNTNTNVFTVRVIDSRGYDNSKTVTLSKIDYINLTNSVDIKRVTSTGGHVKLSTTGNYYNASFGDVHNTLELSWSIREKGTSEFTQGGTLEPKIENNTYSLETEIENPLSDDSLFDYTKNYEFRIFYKDKLISSFTSESITKGIAIFELYDGAILMEGSVLFYDDTKFIQNEDYSFKRKE